MGNRTRIESTAMLDRQPIPTVIREPLRCDLCGSTSVWVNGGKKGIVNYCQCQTCLRSFKVRIVEDRADVIPTLGISTPVAH